MGLKGGEHLAAVLLRDLVDGGKAVLYSVLCQAGKLLHAGGKAELAHIVSNLRSHSAVTSRTQASISRRSHSSPAVWV